MLSWRLQKAMHRKKSCSMMPQFSWDNIAKVKTLCNVVQEAPENTSQEKILFNVVLILLEQYCTSRNLCNDIHEVPDNIVQEKILVNVVWTKSLHSNFYFGPVNILIIITSCCKYCSNIAQISATLHKKNPGPTWDKKTRFYGPHIIF